MINKKATTKSSPSITNCKNSPGNANEPNSYTETILISKFYGVRTG